MMKRVLWEIVGRLASRLSLDRPPFGHLWATFGTRISFLRVVLIIGIASITIQQLKSRCAFAPVSRR